MRGIYAADLFFLFLFIDFRLYARQIFPNSFAKKSAVVNVLALKRYPLVAVFIFIQLFVMIAGPDRAAWPFITFPMYARLDAFKNWKLYTVSAVDRDGNQVQWSAIQKSFSPYTKPVDLNFFLNTYPPPAVCEFFLNTLGKLDGIDKLVVSLNQADLNESIPFTEFSRERGCVQIH